MAPRHAAATAAALAALLLRAAPAAAQDLYQDFQADGQIDACAYSPGQLQNGLNNLPPDLQQYAPGFGDQLRAGLEAQCGAGGGLVIPDTGVAGPLPGGGGPTIKFPKPPVPKPPPVTKLSSVAAPPVPTTPVGVDQPGWLSPLLAAGFVLLLGMFAALRISGVSAEPVYRPLRAAFADAGARTGDAVAYLRDLARYGR